MTDRKRHLQVPGVKHPRPAACGAEYGFRARHTDLGRLDLSDVTCGKCRRSLAMDYYRAFEIINDDAEMDPDAWQAAATAIIRAYDAGGPIPRAA